MRFAAAEAIRADADSNRHELNAFTEWATEHAEEEQEHHLWFLDDLSTVGISAEEINENIPHTAILELLGVQFSLISTTHPVGVLGYFLAMECSPSNPDRVKSLAENLGLPDEVLRTILYHTVVDQDHRREIIAISDKYSSHPTHRAAMTTGAIAALTGWSLYFHERQKIGAPNQAG
ncbi:hypothetical protein GCM10010368_48690 [Streptomyces roseiscleroticus]|uniref:Uncharacterized protein n=1 Tax=Streptomyces roseiscleroticus TaxID=1972 RepID=A0ABP5RW88_9ACTN